MLTISDLTRAFRRLGLRDKPVVAHASLSAFGYIEGAAPTLVEALLASAAALVMPTHTYAPLVAPKSGPPQNGMNYESPHRWSLHPEPFYPNMPADKMMGIVPEVLRQWPGAERSMHPVLSFAGVHASEALGKQTLDNPFAPLLELANQDGWCLLLGVDHTANTAIHCAEKLAGRKQFTRWAWTDAGTVEFQGFPSCSSNFEAMTPLMREYTTDVRIGEARVRAFPLRSLIREVRNLIRRYPDALLCNRPDCERCADVRQALDDQFYGSS